MTNYALNREILPVVPWTASFGISHRRAKPVGTLIARFPTHGEPSVEFRKFVIATDSLD
jgi:hypothetical protein